MSASLQEESAVWQPMIIVTRNISFSFTHCTYIRLCAIGGTEEEMKQQN